MEGEFSIVTINYDTKQNALVKNQVLNAAIVVVATIVSHVQKYNNFDFNQLKFVFFFIQFESINS